MKAYELLSDEKKWARNAYAYTAYGGTCDPRSPVAVCFCALGAIEKCYYEDNKISKEYLDVTAKLRNRVGNIPYWNDAIERTHKEVVAVLKELNI